MNTSQEKRGSVRCNGDFLMTSGDRWCGVGGYYSTKGTKIYIPIYSSNTDIGNAVNESLSKSINLPFSNKMIEILQEESASDWEEQVKYLKEIYGYKTGNAVLHNMMSCPLELNEFELKISPMQHCKQGWKGVEEKKDIIVKRESPKEIIGAAVRIGFTRCVGKGAQGVRKALFPEGEPEEVEEYLEREREDYKEWLIACYHFGVYYFLRFIIEVHEDRRMKLMSYEKRGSIDCNTDFISVEGDKWCGYGGCGCTNSRVYLEIKCSNRELGFSVNNVLAKSIHLQYSEKIVELIESEAVADWEEQVKYFQKTYGYKTSTALYKMLCLLNINDGKLRISPMKRKGPGSYVGLENEYDIILKQESPEEIIGAAVRIAFTRCRGNGVIGVRKALFPEGEPEEVEEYLEREREDYKEWLISI